MEGLEATECREQPTMRLEAQGVVEEAAMSQQPAGVEGLEGFTISFLLARFE